jgi:SPP1 family predicted phage head-tail adaptor
MIGQLKYRAIIEDIKKQSNGRGGWTEAPAFVAEIWVAHYRVTQRQQVEFKQANMRVEDKFICRDTDLITQNSRILVNGRKYRIEAIERPIDPQGYLEIYAAGETIGAKQ